MLTKQYLDYLRLLISLVCQTDINSGRLKSVSQTFSTTSKTFDCFIKHAVF